MDKGREGGVWLGESERSGEGGEGGYVGMWECNLATKQWGLLSNLQMKWERISFKWLNLRKGTSVVG